VSLLGRAVLRLALAAAVYVVWAALTSRRPVFVNPLVMWICVAGGIMLIGGLIAAWPGPSATRKESAAAAAPAAAADA
jgi:hypothetical protein